MSKLALTFGISVTSTHSSLYPTLLFFDVSNWCGKDSVLDIAPKEKKSRGVISGERGGQGVGSSLPIHRSGNVSSRKSRTKEPQCGGAPSC
ncbi:hypothetical protein AVEN_253728-1 [Araneus ventricosus]|uniref:Uncharacterized protein n=1 Tax=Araneus ventricosus TaxID=182803 RepID=A0A4Y2DYP2_ARAVE|nr:hypothetical protein AVEN_253728-1 [Araneus ventricosus]